MKLLSALLVLFVSFGLNAQTKKIDTSKSTINWIGKKVLGKHEGTINFKDGSLTFDKSKLTGGSFTVDMATISATDVEGKTKEKLDGHLKSDDFFGVENHPTSQLEFTNVTDKGNGVYEVTADLTIKGITSPVNFTLYLKNNTATTNLKVDRTKHDIKYGSKSFFDNLGDKAINDEFELEVKLVF